MKIDRKAIATARAKAQAYKECGKDAEATIWARELVEHKHRESREVLRLRLSSPNRTTTPQHDAAYLPLFVAVNEPTLF